jgi:hypothetical protein
MSHILISETYKIQTMAQAIEVNLADERIIKHRGEPVAKDRPHFNRRTGGIYCGSAQVLYDFMNFTRRSSNMHKYSSK